MKIYAFGSLHLGIQTWRLNYAAVESRGLWNTFT